MTKKAISSEALYLIGLASLSFAVNIMEQADFGMSMIVSPAFILSKSVSFLTYGQAEYIVASLIFILFCIIMKKFKVAYLSSFITGALYATMADVWKVILPVYPVTSQYVFFIRITYFCIGLILSALAIAMFYKTYFYPQIYDFFVKQVATKYNISLQIFKTGFDCTFLIFSVLFSLLVFHKLVGVGIGTVIMAICNGTLINYFKNQLDKYFVCVSRLNRLAKYLENEGGI